MSISGIILAAVIVGATGCVIGFFLCFFAEKFKVEVDPREEAIIEVLPGNNCGGCGYAGCSGLAAAIVANEAPCNQCPVGGNEVGNKVAEIMGVSVENSVRKVAFVMCDGTCNNAKTLYDYSGVKDCKALLAVPGKGPKACSYGCCGFGTCVKACPFDAIHIVDGVAVVDKERCKACGKCIEACPNHLIELINYDSSCAVCCHNNDKGKAVMDVCSVGCIGCHKCERTCPSNAITVESFFAHIDQDKCQHCNLCKDACPRHIIK